MRTSTNKVQPGTLHESDKEDPQVLVLRVSGQLSIRAQETSSIYSIDITVNSSPSVHKIDLEGCLHA